jgi:NAD-dependent dihydropyrimidine dehydrogenase PreA subunit
VKLLRLWLLVLLAALMPVRGAMAAAMLCPPAAASHEQAHAHGAQASHHDVDHQHLGSDEATATHHHDGSVQDKCSLCASCCSMVPLISSFPSIPEPFEATQRFDDLSVRAPSFFSDGQERPPRSI